MLGLKIVFNKNIVENTDCVLNVRFLIQRDYGVLGHYYEFFDQNLEKVLNEVRYTLVAYLVYTYFRSTFCTMVCLFLRQTNIRVLDNSDGHDTLQICATP